jgi:Tol biopolymer transport system component
MLRGIIMKRQIRITVLLTPLLLSCFLLRYAEGAESDKSETGVPASLKKMRIAYLDEGDIWIMKGDGTSDRRITERGDVSILFGWSHDDRMLLFGTGDAESDRNLFVPEYSLWTLDMKSGKADKVGGIRAMDAGWVPGKTDIAFLETNESLWISGLDGGGAGKIVDSGAKLHGISPDGGKVAYTKPARRETDEDGGEKIVESNIMLRDIKSGRTVKLTSGNKDNAPLWLPDMKGILFRRGFDMWVMGPEGSNQRKLREGKFINSADTVLPDGRWLIINDLVLQPISVIADIETGEVKILTYDNTRGGRILPSPGGEYLMYVSRYESEIKVIDLDGKVLAETSMGVYPCWANREVAR